MLELNEKEATALINLINLAVKTGGLEVAENALYLTKKIQAAFSKPQELKKEE